MMDAKKVILYVDDEKPLLRIFKALFRKEFQILLAESGEEALELLENSDVDVILTDQIMGGMKGTQFLEKFHQTHPNAPPYRLMISGYSEDEDVNKSFKEHGLVKFINKPWNAEELQKLLEDFANK